MEVKTRINELEYNIMHTGRRGRRPPSPTAASRPRRSTGRLTPPPGRTPQAEASGGTIYGGSGRGRCWGRGPTARPGDRRRIPLEMAPFLSISLPLQLQQPPVDRDVLERG